MVNTKKMIVMLVFLILGCGSVWASHQKNMQNNHEIALRIASQFKDSGFNLKEPINAESVSAFMNLAQCQERVDELEIGGVIVLIVAIVSNLAWLVHWRYANRSAQSSNTSENQV